MKVQQGYRCILPDCDGATARLSTHLHEVQKHRGRVNWISHQGAEAGIQRVQLQILFAQKRQCDYLSWGSRTPWRRRCCG